MKSFNLLYTSDSQLEEFIYANEIQPEKEYLVRIHTGIHDSENIKELLKTVKKLLPYSHIAGCSNSAVILNGRILREKCLVSITEFADASVKTCLVPMSDGIRNYTSDELAEMVCRNSSAGNDSAFMLTFVSTIYSGIRDFVDGINNRFPHIQLLGGIANHPITEYPNFHEMKSFVFTEDGVLKSGIAVAVINSHKISVNSEVVYVTEQVGKTYTITETDDIIIRKVNGTNAVDWYQNILGINLSELEDYENITSTFPIVKKDYGNIPWLISYSPQNEKNSVFPGESQPLMYTTVNLKAGDQIKIAYSSMQHTIEVCQNVCNNLKNKPSDVLFAYSCLSRMSMFKNCADWEFTPFKRTNLSGAIMIGEIGNAGGANRFCNYTTVIASLAESPNKPRIDTSALAINVNMLYDNNQHIINYLISHSEEENTVAVKQRRDIEKRLFTDAHTGLGNITKYFYDVGKNIINKICLVSIRNKSLITAFMSKENFEENSVFYLNQIAKFLGNDYFCYFYNNSFLIIASSEKISSNSFIAKIKEVQALTMTQKYNSYAPVCEFAVVMNENDMLPKAEMILEKMDNSHECIKIYNKNSSIENERAETIRMINILNDAIVNDRIIPYFQGIYDNTLGYVTGYEALMRIEDENGNIYFPASFIPVAKEYGFYNEISYMMIDKVMKLFRNRNEKVTINIDVNDIYNYDIIHMILDFLKKIPYPENFIFEITESEEIKDYQIIDAFTDAIISAGGKIAIDDFGNGFSNLVHLLKINADYIKIDGEIVKNICNDEYALELMQIISSWAERHNRYVIAEFVENEEIQKLVKNSGIRYSQGYYYSRPEKRFF